MRKIVIILLCLSFLMGNTAIGQRNQKKIAFNRSGKTNDIFLSKQWWMGLKAGPNLSRATVLNPYSVVSPTDYKISEIAKQYEHFNSAGTQVTFEATFYFRGFSVSAQPTYRTNRFIYGNHYRWIDPGADVNRLDLNYKQEQRVAYLDLPLLVRYEFPTTSVKPYVQAGVYSAMLLDAKKHVEVSGVDYASGGANSFQSETIMVGATDLFAPYHWGFTGGAGIYYPLGNIRLNLEAMYRHGMSNIASAEHRYGSDRLSGVGDSLDDMTLQSFSFTVGCLFPLRFLGSGFRSMTDN